MGGKNYLKIKKSNFFIMIWLLCDYQFSYDLYV